MGKVVSVSALVSVAEDVRGGMFNVGGGRGGGNKGGAGEADQREAGLGGCDEQLLRVGAAGDDDSGVFGG